MPPRCGIECSHFAFRASIAFETWEKGLLTAEQTDGMRFDRGNVAVVDKLLDLCARREGKWGELLAEGPYEVAEAIGGDAMKWVVYTEKGTPALHDWRSHVGQMLKELVASGGMKPQGQGTGVTAPSGLCATSLPRRHVRQERIELRVERRAARMGIDPSVGDGLDPLFP